MILISNTVGLCFMQKCGLWSIIDYICTRESTSRIDSI